MNIGPDTRLSSPDVAPVRGQETNGHHCELTQREAEVLRYLAANPGRTISRDEFLERVWRLNPQRIITRTVDMHIARLRDKLGQRGGQPAVLLTVHGYGYMLAANRRAEQAACQLLASGTAA
jgi:DNA-binding response OmpR family regulator